MHASINLALSSTSHFSFCVSLISNKLYWLISDPKNLLPIPSAVFIGVGSCFFS